MTGNRTRVHRFARVALPRPAVAAAAAVAGAVFPAATSASASTVGMAVLTQDRSVNVSAKAAPGTNAGDFTQTDAKHATSADPFAAKVVASARGGQAQDPSMAWANASQDSVAKGWDLSASGQVEANSANGTGGSGAATADSLYHVRFQTDALIDFTLSTSYLADGDPSQPDSVVGTVELTDAAGHDLLPTQSAADGSAFARSGSLPAGVYSLVLHVAATSSDETDNVIDYSMLLHATPAAQAIPLPAAVYGGTGLLGAIAWRNRRVMKC